MMKKILRGKEQPKTNNHFLPPHNGKSKSKSKVILTLPLITIFNLVLFATSSIFYFLAIQASSEVEVLSAILIPEKVETSKEETHKRDGEGVTRSIPIQDSSHVPQRSLQFSNPRQQNAVSSYLEVFENHLPEDSLHQEGASCELGSKLYIIGGLLTQADDEVMKKVDGSIANRVVTIYDMETMKVTLGPKLPLPCHHITCASTPEGVLHVTGGFGEAPTAPSFTTHFALDTKNPEGKWETLADVPQSIGAHGCEFAYDEKMYCVGGGTTQWGPFVSDLHIYDPESNTWAQGNPMPTPRDHLMNAIAVMDNGKKLYVVGGRSHRGKGNHPALWKNVDVAEVYDVVTGEWSEVRNINISRNSVEVTTYARRGPDREPNIILVGGQQNLGYQGQIFSLIEEYDVERDVYYCLDNLAFGMHGGSVGIWENKLHVVGGSDWFGAGASRRVQVFDLAKAPAPRQCFHYPIPVKPDWKLYFVDNVKMWPEYTRPRSCGKFWRRCDGFRTELEFDKKYNEFKNGK